MSLRRLVINRTQALVLVFFLLAWASVITILAAAPQVYDQTLRRAPTGPRAAEIIFAVALSGLMVVLLIGVVRRWCWLFWLILTVFFLGVLRVPAAVLQLSGHLSPGGPTWYIIFQGAAGVIQFAIALTMLTGYRRCGIWGAF